MAEGTDHVEDRLSCDDSSYSERNLEVYDSSNSVNSGSEDEAYGGGDMDALEKEPYQFKHTGTDWTTLRLCILLLLVPKMVLTLCNLRWCLILVDPICMCTHTNEHVLCGGCCMWWLLYVVFAVCVCASSRCALTVMCVCGV